MGFLVPAAEKHPQGVMLPPPCFTVGLIASITGVCRMLLLEIGFPSHRTRESFSSWRASHVRFAQESLPSIRATVKVWFMEASETDVFLARSVRVLPVRAALDLLGSRYGSLCIGCRAFFRVRYLRSHGPTLNASMTEQIIAGERCFLFVYTSNRISWWRWKRSASVVLRLSVSLIYLFPF